MHASSRIRRRASALVDEPGVLGTRHGLHLDAVVAQVVDAVLAEVAAFDDQDAGDPGVVDHLRAHRAGLAGDDEPRIAGSHAVGRGVAHHVHLGVVAADLHSLAGRHAECFSKTRFAATQATAAARPAVVAVHEHDVAGRIEEQRPELAPRAVRRLGQRQALLDPDRDVLVVHSVRTLPDGLLPRQ